MIFIIFINRLTLKKHVDYDKPDLSEYYDNGQRTEENLHDQKREEFVLWLDF